MTQSSPSSGRKQMPEEVLQSNVLFADAFNRATRPSAVLRKGLQLEHASW